MKIHLYAFSYQDGKMLPFFLKYYSTIVDKMTIYDSGSTDNSNILFKKYGVEVKQTGHKVWDWDAGQKLMNEIWKGADCDYVIFPDIDEIYYHPNLREYLESKVGEVDIFQSRGFQMVSKVFPKDNESLFDIKMGVADSLYNKFRIFNPKIKITFVSAHDIRTTSRKLERFSTLNLHYKYLGVDELVRRADLVKKRVPPDSICKAYNKNLLAQFPGLVKSRQQYQVELNSLLMRSVRVLP